MFNDILLKFCNMFINACHTIPQKGDLGKAQNYSGRYHIDIINSGENMHKLLLLNSAMD